MSGSQEEMLREIIRAGDVERCLAFFEDMAEKERKKLAQVTLRWTSEYRGTLWEPTTIIVGDNGKKELRGHRYKEGDPNQATTVYSALWATASLTQLKRLRWSATPPYTRQLDWRVPILKVLRNRKPDWLPALCKWLLEAAFSEWRLVRRIVREGLCEPPDSEMYVLGMIVGIKDPLLNHNVVGGLRNDPELLENMVWRLFELQGNRQASLSYLGDSSIDERSWSYALRELSKEGALDRQRLLDESLTALNRDFTQYHAGWFSRFHEYMEPTVEEHAARANRYLDLLASPIQPTVTMAVKALRVLHKAGRLDAAAFVARAEPALYAKAKAAVKQTLGMLGDIAGKQPALAAEVSVLVTAALEHKAAEIQQSALTLIEKHGSRDDAALRDAVEERLTAMAATTRKNAEAWLGAEESAAPSIAESEPEEISELVQRAQALPERHRSRYGLDSALTEVTAPQGTVAAIPGSASTDSGKPGLFAAALKALRTPFENQKSTGYRPGVSNEWAVSENILRDVLIEVQFGSRDAETRQAWAKCDRPAYTRDVLRIPRWLDRQRPAYEPQSPFFKDMQAADTPLMPVGMVMLCMNLGVADAEDGQSAADVLIQSIRDGRLDGVKLGGSMRLLLKVGLVKPNKWVSQLVKPNRWAERLAVAAGESPLHAQVVRNALILALPAIPAEGTRNIHMLLELLYDLCIEAEEAVADPDCRAFLEGIGGTGKAAKLAKKLLALEQGAPCPTAAPQPSLPCAGGWSGPSAGWGLTGR